MNYFLFVWMDYFSVEKLSIHTKRKWFILEFNN